MATLLISTGPDTTNLRYASGFYAPDPVAFLLEKKKGYLVVPSLEYSRAVKQAKNCTVWTPEELGLKPGKSGPTEWAVALVKKTRAKNITVSKTFPHSAALALQKEKIKVNVAEGELFPERMVKSDEEIRNITQSQKAAADAVRLAVKMIQQSTITRAHELKLAGSVLTSERVRAEIEKFLSEKECGTFDTIVAGGAQAADPHEIGSGPLPSNAPIILDIFPYSRTHGYFGDITRTVIKEPPTQIHKRMYQTVFRAQKLALSKLKAGIEGKAIHDAVAEFIEVSGYTTEVKDGVTRGFFHGTGHGVGLDIHEAPGVSLRPGKLKAGHVVTIEPGIYDPDIGSVRIEDTVLVTADGYKMLSPCSKTFQVKY